MKTNFKYFDPRIDNSEGASDCVIRAYSAVFGIKWHEAFLLASISGFNHGCMPNDNKAISAVMKTMHCKKEKLSDKSITVNEFAVEHPKGKYLILSKDHATTLFNGTIVDAWNPSRRKVEAVYRIPKKEIVNKILESIGSRGMLNIFCKNCCTPMLGKI